MRIGTSTNSKLSRQGDKLRIRQIQPGTGTVALIVTVRCGRRDRSRCWTRRQEKETTPLVVLSLKYAGKPVSEHNPATLASKIDSVVISYVKVVALNNSRCKPTSFTSRKKIDG
jgi:hypothetical protein